MNQKIISAGTPSNGQDMDIKQAQHKRIKIFPKIHSKRKKNKNPVKVRRLSEYLPTYFSMKQHQ